ncbi:hypothetical protein JCM6882_005582 [Rhodosporidiobolus microsporus]
MAQYGYHQPQTGAGGAQLAGTPVASTSALGSSAAIQSTRSGRISKPVKPFTPATQPTRASRTSSSLNPNATRAGPPPPPQRHPLSTTPLAVPPMTRITGTGNEAKQAMFTTYPARMRLGTSSLMQPNAFADKVNAAAASAGGTGANTPVIGAKRQRSTVNYAELEQFPAELDEESDDEGARKRGGSGTPSAQPKKSSASAAAAALAAVEKKPEVWGDGKSYLGALPPGTLVQVQPAKGTKHLAVSEEELEEHAETPGAFVAVQIDLDVDAFKVRDSFVWNINEKLVTPEAFARTFCDDLDLPATFVEQVTKQITDQVAEQAGVAEFALRSDAEEKEQVEKDLRVIVNLDVQIGALHLTDRLEWDLSSSLTPELFAATLVRDLSLDTNAAPVIATAIHEELFRLKKSCIEMGLVGVDEAVMRRRGAKPLEGVWREWNDAEKYGPKVDRLSLDELDRVEQDRERAIRRAKRDRLGGARNAGRPKR